MNNSADGARNPEPVLRVENLVKHFDIRRGILFKRRVGTVAAVDGVSFSVNAGETLGIVGESGCGKSTVARTLTRLHEPTSGHAYFNGEDLFAMGTAELRRARRDIQMIFQDPYTSLDPRMTVGDIVAEGWRVHPDVVPRSQHNQRAAELFEMVGLNPDHVCRYPHQFSGGQRQRVGFARAIALNPSLIICDEPVSALDVSVQAQVVNLLADLQKELNLTYVFIAHDLSVVRHISDRIAVMYLGRIVEEGTGAQLYESPVHPYTQALLSAVPSPDLSTRRSPQRILLEGDVPSPTNPPSGCRFRTRCWKATDRCADEIPELELRGFDHPSACFHADPSPGENAPTRELLRAARDAR